MSASVFFSSLNQNQEGAFCAPHTCEPLDSSFPYLSLELFLALGGIALMIVVLSQLDNIKGYFQNKR